MRKLTNERFEDFKREARWTPDGPTAFDSYSNYCGADLSGWYRGPGQTRDSDALSRSNFICALEELGGESETVMIGRFGHWACGWYETILVRADDESRVRQLFEMHVALQDYPVLDEMHFSELEYEEAQEAFEDNQSAFTRELIEACGIDRLSKAAARIESHPELEKLLSLLFNESCAHSGYADGWITKNSAQRDITRIEIDMNDSTFYRRVRALIIARAEGRDHE